MNKEQIPVYIGALMIAVAGAIGGMVNSMLIYLKLVQAATTLTVVGKTIKITCFINAIAGVTAALFSWGLYGPAGNLGVFGSMDRNLLTIASVFGAGLVGYSGSSWLTTHADKREWQKNTEEAIDLQPNDSTAELSRKIPSLSPTVASKMIQNLHK
jgi:hypothetical protein